MCVSVPGPTAFFNSVTKSCLKTRHVLSRLAPFVGGNVLFFPNNYKECLNVDNVEGFVASFHGVDFCHLVGTGVGVDVVQVGVREHVDWHVDIEVVEFVKLVTESAHLITTRDPFDVVVQGSIFFLGGEFVEESLEPDLPHALFIFLRFWGLRRAMSLLKVPSLPVEGEGESIVVTVMRDESSEAMSGYLFGSVMNRARSRPLLALRVIFSAFILSLSERGKARRAFETCSEMWVFLVLGEGGRGGGGKVGGGGAAEDPDMLREKDVLMRARR